MKPVLAKTVSLDKPGEQTIYTPENRESKKTMESSEIKKNVTKILQSIPTGVSLVAAAKTRTSKEVKAAVQAGVKIIGHNYVQEAESMYEDIGEWSRSHGVKWHFIGHLQRNKAKKAVQMFDMIETLDSVRLAKKLQQECEKADRTMDVLIEVNSGDESNKTGVAPEEVKQLVSEISFMDRLRIKGLMTMGPFDGDPEDTRPYFRLTKNLFEDLSRASVKNVSMEILSMGMSNSYPQAIEEGSNMVRIGTSLFGLRYTCAIKT